MERELNLAHHRGVTESQTVPHALETLPVRSLRVEIVDGPDAGKRLSAIGDLITVGTAPGNTLVVSDNTVSRYHIELRREEGRIEVEDHRSTNGTLMSGAVIHRAAVPPGTVLSLGKTKLKIDDGDTIEVELHQADRLGGMLGRTPEMRRLMATIERAAMTDASLLVLGETGTGKEVVARAIHSGSRRSEAPFMTVDCGSLLPTLVASELFGHERGAFTGADQQHIGAFERADGGTLFLDEIGELPAPLQATLLGALERRSFRRVGGTKSVQIDVRVVAATNRDLREEVNRGSFRADLYYRLAVLSLKLPPLRERTDDIPLLLENFLREQGYAGEVEALIPREVMESLKQYRWPGNVRELRNFVDAALAMGVAPRLEGELSSGPGLVAEVSLRNLTTENYHETRDRVLAAFEKLYLPHLLERTRGNVALASREANMDRSYLIQLLKKHGLK